MNCVCVCVCVCVRVSPLSRWDNKKKSKKSKKKKQKTTTTTTTTKKSNKKQNKTKNNNKIKKKKTKKKQQITTKKKSENITYFAGIQVVFRTLAFSHVSDFHFRNTLSYFFTQQCQKCESPKIETLTSLKQCQNKRHLKGALLDGIVEGDPTTPPAELHTPRAIQWSISHTPTTEAHTHWLTDRCQVVY